MCTKLMLNKSYGHLYLQNKPIMFDSIRYVNANRVPSIVIYVASESSYCKWQYEHC